MAREKEIKIILKIPHQSFIKKITSFGFQETKTIKQKDIYFDTKDWFLYKNLAALRLRYVNTNEHSFSFKKIFYLPKKIDKYYIEEIEIPAPFISKSKMREIFNKISIPAEKGLNSGSKITDFLISSGFLAEQKMNKVRKIFSNTNAEIVIDDIENVGTVVELESFNEEPIKIINKILAKSEWKRNLEGSSYMWLSKVKGFNSHKSNLKKFLEKPMWNVWKNEIDFYKKINN